MSGKPSGRLHVSSSFDGEIPSVVAAPLFLDFFGCALIDKMKGSVDLSIDHEMIEFRYSNYKEQWVLNPKYGAGKLGIEQHEFVHLECPLEEESGHFLIGKWDPDADSDDEDKPLLLTAFKIPQYHTVYIAPNVIHSNDHLEGLWRTVLSTFKDDDAKANVINHVLLEYPCGDAVDLSFSRDAHDLQLEEVGFSELAERPAEDGLEETGHFTI